MPWAGADAIPRREERTIGWSDQPRPDVKMIYKFHSQATGDVIMLGPHGDHFLSLLGREPAPKGILEVAHMPEALARMDAALAAAEAAASRRETDGEQDADATGGVDPVTLRQRLFPMFEMIRTAHAAGKPIVWGV